MTMFFAGRTCAAIAMFVFAQPASAETWTCSLKENTQSGFVAETVTVVRLDDAGAVKIKDAMIEEYREGWQRGTIDVENDRRITVKWRLPFVRNPPTISASPQTNLFYSLTIQKAGLTARIGIQSFPHGTGRMRTYSGSGQCTISK